MHYWFRAGLCIALTFSSVSTAALAKNAPVVVTEQARAVPGGRSVQVAVAQTEIKSNINASMLAEATGGGLLGGLLAASQNAARTKKAEAAIEPIRVAMTGFDADALAVSATQTGLAGLGWMNSTPPVFTRDSSMLGRSAVLDAGANAQVAFIEYTYDLSPDFVTVRVVASIDFANKAIGTANPAKPETRLLPKNLAFHQTITAIVALPATGANMQANAALWAADGAKLARAALTKAFSQIGALMPRALTLTDADITALTAKDHKRTTLYGFTGRLVPTNTSGTLLWNDGDGGPGFIVAQSL